MTEGGPMASEAGYTIDRDEQGLTARDRQVRDLLAEGKKQKDIAEILGVNKSRVSGIVKRLREVRGLELPGRGGEEKA